MGKERKHAHDAGGALAVPGQDSKHHFRLHRATHPLPLFRGPIKAFAMSGSRKILCTPEALPK